ncbi:hypothetical protein DM02DRAFT_665532 [Periconia macrospinosa]|uniref:Uncharacterized protein n=1 Tax=Periconia macrospinosa TaxID=97972 RepID=A0A2V1CWR6_9PLEO|nr:hypothetical protein DM02DRAFT_665532 [Periconia macrospinosa]
MALEAGTQPEIVTETASHPLLISSIISTESIIDFNAFNEELLNRSPLYDIDDLWLSSPPPAAATQPINEQQSDSSLNDGSRNNDKLYKGALAYKIRDDCSEGTFGDKEHVLVASDQYS